MRWSIGMLIVIAGCSGPPAAPTTPLKPAALPAPQEVKQEVAGARPSVPSYAARGRRDPVETLGIREGAAGPLVASAKLTGILNSVGGTMALVETSDGIGYILKAGDTLGDGRLLEIGPDRAVFSIASRPGSTSNRVVLRLASD